MRLDRLLANLGYGSRREVTSMLKNGRLTRADGSPVREGDRWQHEDLRLDGEPLDPPAPLTILLNKPVGYTCSTEDEGPLIYDLLPPRFAARNPVLASAGRLDKDTSGLLIMTDDGQLLHRLISPKKEVWKTYSAELARPLSGDEADVFASGTLTLENDAKPCKPARFSVVTEAGSAEKPVVTVGLTEGRYHQVRRMFAAVGNHVEKLSRIQIGGLECPPDLEEGDWRILMADELATVFAGE